MNIKITHREHEFLQSHTIRTHVIGSHLYGSSNENSDKDYLCIYRSPWVKTTTGFPNHHQFQYDDDSNNTDWIYCEEEQFWKNLNSGDSTINADIILFGDGSDEYKIATCRTYKIIKAYLGFAKRDLAQKGAKKITHAARGLYCAKSLLDGKLPLLEEVKAINLGKEIYTIGELDSILKTTREALNEAFNKKLIPLYNIPVVEDELLQKLLDANNVLEFKYN